MFDGPLKDMMKQAQKMTGQMEEAQQAIALKEVIGESGAGLVSVTLNGNGDCRSVKINPNVLTDDPEIVGELIASAINDANLKLEALKKDSMSSFTEGLNLPPGFKFPFS
ncbi:YbaB/EbfC family nucleoid-associated protein [Litorivicinus sp.]|jgi:DNA-binding YbaB/EbfC family protein|nr:YbaB/EbfC family nucleoid-associated protein [Litorivicinus sp.]MDB9862426.1 YbaB/EbfC family nucleoid-associated protein [Litorivicinus sp.]MDC1208631.1 YbaB/EbfC family nucleoid-associated protein [Litorivicinus sp.]|tara:strand:- start:4616 stop:4945 length:330 start_codon:yes stop_codon:yes gene_type:complete